MTSIPLEQPASVYNPLQRILPQPPVSEGYAKAKEFAQTVVRGLAGAVSTTAGLSGVGGDYASLIEQQIEVQKQMMLTSMISNLEKSKHETQMAPVRNIRVG